MKTYEDGLREGFELARYHAYVDSGFIDDAQPIRWDEAEKALEKTCAAPPVLVTDWPGQAIDLDEMSSPHAWIQWKGTDVCMDVHCVCGHHGHVDSWFAYFYRCIKCGVTFVVGCNVRLYPIDPAHVERIAGDRAKVDCSEADPSEDA